MAEADPTEGEELPAPPLSVKIHPIVVFSVLDHYIRRQEGQERVIGTLLGSYDETTGVCEITNAYAVPHTETHGEVAVGQQFNKNMFDLLSRVNADEQIVGWYATNAEDGQRVDGCSSLIHKYYSAEAAPAVHVVVDPRLEGDAGVVVTAFEGTEVEDPGEDGDAYSFAEVPNAMEFDEGEKICIDRMVRGQKDPWASAEMLADVSGDADTAQADVDELIEGVDEVIDYVAAQQKAGKPIDPKCARAMSEAAATLPKIESAITEGSLQAETQDVLMVSYLASITKAQLAITSKIHESF
jgi:translation initiation factor 3 subunit F